jgi:MscS family membrane protein
VFLISATSWAQQEAVETGAERGETAAEQAPAGAEDMASYAFDTSSPREVLANFQRLSGQLQAAMENYRETHDRKRADRIGLVLDQWLLLIDLSKVAEATRREVGAETAAYLLDVFNRIPLPTLDDVPDATAFKADGPASFLIPDTPFRIVLMDSGPRQGEFLFSEHTVQSAPQFHATIEDLPLRPGQSVTSWITEFRRFTGPLVPVALSDAVPDNLQRPVFGTPIWKIIAVLVLTLATTLFLLVWNRATTHPAWGGLVGARWRLLLSPLAVLLSGIGLRDFFSYQIIVAGQFAAATYAGLTLAIFVALAWTIWVLILAIFETAISRSALPEQNFDANMLRLIARIIGFVGGFMVLAYGAQDIGLPVFSLLAGLGIGGIAIALAIRPTLENLIGGFILYLDRPIRVGDFCTFGDRSGTVESIGIRSTQVRANDRTLITVPNAQFADMQIVNWAQCDRMLIKETIGLRYETDEDQLRYVIAKLREMLIGHPRIDSETVRVRFSDFGACSLDVAIRVYAVTREWNDFFAIKEDVQFRIMSIVEKSGTGFAFPSQTLYMGTDDGLDPALAANARQEVAAWRRRGQLPFPNFAEARQHQLDGRLSYPPPGSPDFNATPEELEDAGGEPLSAEPLHEESDTLAENQQVSDEAERR